MKKIGNIFKLIFSPEAFADAELEETKRQEKEERASYGDKVDWRAEILRRASKKRQGFLITFLQVGSACGLGFALSLLINTYHPIGLNGVRAVRLSALIVVAWAVLGRIGYESPSAGGRTLLEQTSEATYKFFYLIGLVITTMALFLIPF